MNSGDSAASASLTVPVANDLVLMAGNWRHTVDDQSRPVAHIEPPGVPMFAQVVQYLEAKPSPHPSYVRLADEARAAVAVCLRLGSYFGVLTDASRPHSPTIRDESTSQVHDAEMARMNIEISAATAWWFTLKGSDDKRYVDLVRRALAYLPLGRRTVGRSSQGEALRILASSAMSAAVHSAWPAERLEQDWRLASTHSVRVIANTVTLKVWRNGPIENVHAGRSIGHAMGERRVMPRDEKAIVSCAQDGFYGALKAVESLTLDGAWPPPADRVLPFMTPYLFPAGWTLMEQSCEVEFPLRNDAVGR